MASATTLTHDIRVLTDVKPESDGLRISFAGGATARLLASHPSFALLRVIAESARGGSRPVGVVLGGDGCIADLNVCHDTSVRSVVPFPNDPHRFEVSFWGFSPVCGLTSDQFGFDRLHATLVNAIRTGQMVWVAIHPEESVDEEPDEDGLIPTLPKIMDVRPV